MPVQSREQLKSYFRNGTLVREEYFQNLIDSSINPLNDNLFPDSTNGLGVIASAKGRLLSFFKDLTRKREGTPSWVLELINGNNGSEDSISLSIPAVNNTPKRNVLYIKSDTSKPGIINGKVGVNTITPAYELDVNGTIGMKSRVGCFADPSVNPKLIVADGKWHKLITNLKGFAAFEIISTAFHPNGIYAMYYTIALNAFGKNKRICAMQQVYSKRRHRIEMRWSPAQKGVYGLEIRTRSQYNEQPLIYTKVTQLWN